LRFAVRPIARKTRGWHSTRGSSQPFLIGSIFSKKTQFLPVFFEGTQVGPPDL
jgi:hypothetical protein